MLTAPCTAILTLIACSAVVGVGPARSVQQRTPLPDSVDAIPLAKCTVKEALNVSFFQSTEREGASSQLSVTANERMKKLMDSLPKSKLPVSKLMNSDQTTEFEQLRVQMIIQSMDQLAESRLQRDDIAMEDAADAIDALQRGATELTSKDDPKGEGAGLVGVLRKVLSGDQDAQPANPDPNVCSIELAIYKRSSAATKSTVALMQSSDAQMLIQLRKKYGITGPLDPSKLPSPDKEQAVWLLKAVAEPIQRGVAAVHDWLNLLWYAKASQLEYQSLRNDIINGGGPTNYDYDTTINKVAASADPVMKHAVTAWNVIEQAVPSDHQALMEKAAAYSKQLQAAQK
jgi:hypothetical protein